MFAFLRSRSAAPAVIDPLLLETLADAHQAAADDADAALTPARAAAQRAAILARLGATADTRVLSFPPRDTDTGSRTVLSRARAPRPALGWMLTAAAAGLVVGVGTGQGVSLEWPGRDTGAQVRTPVRAGALPVSATAGASISGPAATAEPDDAILGEVEVALAERGVDELQPLDALTPRVTLVASR